MCDRLNNCNAAVEQVVLVKLVNHPIYESAQKVTFSELQHLLRQSCNGFGALKLSTV
ncbi:hypothetical protein D3C80_2155140 [compost metagenome]